MARSKVPAAATRQQPKRTPTINSSKAFGPKSPLCHADLQAFLSRCMKQWENYSPDEQALIVASLPETRQKLYEAQQGESNIANPSTDDGAIPVAPLDPPFLENSEHVKNAVARFKRDLENGFYQKSWQDKAKKASQERADGLFDAYLEASSEEKSTGGTGNGVEEDNTSDSDYGSVRKETKRTKKN